MNILDELKQQVSALEAKVDLLLELASRPAETKAGGAEGLGGIELAERILNLRRSTIYKYTGPGPGPKIPHVRRHGRLYFREQDLREYVLKTKKPVGHAATNHES